MCNACGNSGRVMKHDEHGEYAVDCPNGCCAVCADGSQHGRATCPSSLRSRRKN